MTTTEDGMTAPGNDVDRQMEEKVDNDEDRHYAGPAPDLSELKRLAEGLKAWAEETNRVLSDGGWAAGDCAPIPEPEEALKVVAALPSLIEAAERLRKVEAERDALIDVMAEKESEPGLTLNAVRWNKLVEQRTENYLRAEVTAEKLVEVERERDALRSQLEHLEKVAGRLHRKVGEIHVPFRLQSAMDKLAAALEKEPTNG